MKKKLLVLGLILFWGAGASAQIFSAEVFIQKSLIGTQKGYGLYYLNHKGWGLGPVFQSADGISTERGSNNYPFIGIEGRIPFQTYGRLRMQFVPRVGFVNRDFFVFIPEVQTEYAITKAIGMGIGAGIRVREASISMKVFVKPFKNKKNGME